MKTSNIYTDSNGLKVLAVLEDEFSVDVEGHDYLINTPLSASVFMFQRGPIKEYGINGITTETVLATLIHRTKFLNSKFPCEENESAILHLEAALNDFESRTASRVLRGVEGQNLA